MSDSIGEELAEIIKPYLKLKNQVQILYSQSMITFIFPVIFAFLLSIMLWNVAQKTVLLAWLCVNFIFAFIRYYLLWRYNKAEKKPEDMQQWLNYFITAVCVSGIIWGSAGIILIPYGQQGIIEFTLYNGLIMLTVCGLVAGAVISYSINMTVLLFYSVPALIPPGLYLISLGDNYNSTLGGYILLFFSFISLTAYRMNRQLLSYLEKGYQLESLKHHYLDLKKKYDSIINKT